MCKYLQSDTGPKGSQGDITFVGNQTISYSGLSGTQIQLAPSDTSNLYVFGRVDQQTIHPKRQCGEQDLPRTGRDHVPSWGGAGAREPGNGPGPGPGPARDPGRRSSNSAAEQRRDDSDSGRYLPLQTEGREVRATAGHQRQRRRLTGRIG